VEITDSALSDFADLIEIATPRFADLVKRADELGLLSPMRAGARQMVRELVCKHLLAQIGSYDYLCLPNAEIVATLYPLANGKQPPSSGALSDKASQP
jgi:hypothetical protein